MKKKKFRIAWKVKSSDHHGHGEYIYDDFFKALNVAKWGNKKYPGIEHWVE